MLIALIAALCCILSLSSAKEIDCYGALAKIDLITDYSAKSIYGQPAFFGRSLSPEPLGPFKIIKDSSLEDACTSIPPATLHNQAALVQRGNCSFFHKALNLRNAGYRAMLLYDTSIDDMCIFMHPGDNDTVSDIKYMAIASITATAARSLLVSIPTPSNTLGSATDSISPSEVIPMINILLSLPERNSYFDPSECILLFLAIATIVAGSLWAGHAMHPATRASSRHRNDQHIEADEDGAQIVTMHMAGTFVFVASASLLFLFFFLNAWIAAALIALFAFVSWQSTFFVLSAFFTALHAINFTSPRRRPSPVLLVRLPILGVLTVFDLMALSCSTLLVIAWIYLRSTHWSYLPQDLLCICLMVFVLRSIHLPNLKIASVLLGSALVYDVWWVFIQPMVTGGPSVMVEVASGGGVGMKMPLLLAVPQLHGLGSNPAMSMLGLGDIILPGLLVVLARRWDVSLLSSTNHNNNSSSSSLIYHSSGQSGFYTKKRKYFGPMVASYTIGLVATFFALAFGVGGDQGQPALLYLVPCTLGTMLALGWWHGDTHALWHGCMPIVEIGIDDNDGGDRDEERGLLSSS